jgi:predicted class III extradiol MEMO1 family dioxygenase
MRSETSVSSANAELRATLKFEDMSLSTDEDEHSIEMHLPYIRKVFEGYVAAPLLAAAEVRLTGETFE